MKKKNLIFDFDGTLADTLDLAIQFGVENQARFSERVISKEDFTQHSLRNALKVIGLPLYKLPQFVLELKQFIRENLGSVRVFPGMVEFIREAHGRGDRLFVMSSNSKSNISAFLEMNGISHCFEEIYSDSSIFGKHRVLSKLISNYKLSKDETLYVGDEVRDFQACQKCGVGMIAVSWGWDSKDLLMRSGVDRIVSTADELDVQVQFT